MEIYKTEYPRPEAKREGNWMCLNGGWKFDFDPDNKGMKEKWYEGEKSNYSKTINVPFVFQSELSGINSQEHIDTVWYSKEISIPNIEEIVENNTIVLLHFGAVDYRTEVFINGIYVGTHSGGVTPFHYNIIDYIHKENNKPNNVVVRCWDPPFDPSIPKGKQTVQEKNSGIYYEKILGIWQTVWFEFVPSTYLDRDDSYIRYDWETGSLNTFIKVKGKNNPEYVIETEVFDGDKSVSKIGYVMAKADRHRSSEMKISIDPATLEKWSIKNPKLYNVQFRIIDGESDDETPVDILNCTFGFREIELKDGKFLLNGKPIYLKQLLYQGYWTKGLWTAPTDEEIKKDLELTLEMGFNSLRLHQIVVEPRFYYWADRMGILLWGEFSNAFGGDGASKDNFTKEWPQIVRRDRNHPSIIVWTPINESWGTGDLHIKSNQEWLRSLYYLTKSLDPTRPCNDNDGWEHVLTDIASLHKYSFADAFAGQFPIEKPENLSIFLSNVRPSKEAFAEGVISRGEPVMLTEWGGWAMMPNDPNLETGKGREKAWGYHGKYYNSWDKLMELYESIIDELVKRKSWISGHCYTEFNDQYQEINGMLTFDRIPKGDLSKLKEINDKLYY